MNVQAMGHRRAWGHPQPGHDGMQDAQTAQSVRDRAHAETASTPEKRGHDARGVIRLLQEGHFKGVADVRLRINFFDELQAAGTAKAGNTLQAGVDDLVSSLGDASASPLAALLQEGAQSAEDIAALAAGFEQEAGEILAKFHSGEAGLDETLTALENALLALAEPPADPSGEASETIPEIAAAMADEAQAPVESTADLTTTITTAPESGEDATQTPAAGLAEPEEPEPALPVQDAYAVLREALADLMDDLRQSVADSQALPPLSQPQGNGRAYAKFLAVYTAMLDGTGEAQTGEVPAETLNAQA